jgi:hypothetical protein
MKNSRTRQSAWGSVLESRQLFRSEPRSTQAAEKLKTTSHRNRPPKNAEECNHRLGAQLNERRKLSGDGARERAGRQQGQGLLTFSFLGAAPRAAAAAGLRALPFMASNGACIG